jgi:hypothetical protein
VVDAHRAGALTLKQLCYYCALYSGCHVAFLKEKASRKYLFGQTYSKPALNGVSVPGVEAVSG